MKVVVLGAGAVGSFLGGMLCQEHDVTLVARPEHASAVADRGLRITGLMEAACRPAAACAADGMGPADLTIVAVKAYDMRSACEAARELLRSSRHVLVVQNGLSVLETAPALIGEGACIGVASFGVTRTAPGTVAYMGEGDLHIGGWEAEHLARTLSTCGVPARAAPDIAREVWKKALVSSAINPLTALLDETNAVVADDPCVRSLAVSIYEEGAEAAEACGALRPGDADAVAMLMVAERTGRNVSSMLQDIRRGRRTEVDAINCELVRLGAARGLRMPYNRAMCQLVRAASRGAERGRAP
jgi:2-dehydropantoate 2-reductase